MMVPSPIPLDRCRALVDAADRFEAAPELEEWARSMFLAEDSELYNGDHAHLGFASLGFLVTNVRNASRGHRVLGTCGLGEPSGKPWQKGQKAQQITDWFGHIPTFVITLDACFLAGAEPLQVCALVEHELYHAGQALDQYGSPKFDQYDAPMFDIKLHSVEEFTGVVRRYGAWEPELEEFRKALAAPPIFGNVRIDGICGCGRNVA